VDFSVHKARAFAAQFQRNRCELSPQLQQLFYTTILR
jgi:hypothetical protein